MIVKGLSYIDKVPVSVDFNGGIIRRISKNARPSAIDDSSVYIAPGFIDHQVNGYFGHSFVDPDLSIENVKLITRKLRENGVTSYYPTLITSSKKLLLRNLAVIAKAMEDPDTGLSIAGMHLEGPYISPQDEFHGAHLKKWIRDPDWNEFMELYEASEKNIREITLAPELHGSIDFIAKCIQDNIVVGLGHHNGNAVNIKEAIDAGASIATHLGNGIANFIHHHENPIWPQLADERLMISIIADGFHLTPDEVKVFLKVKGPDNITLVSDVSKLGGLKPGKYNDLVLTEDGMVYFTAQNVKAGASSLINKGVENILKYTSCSLAESIHMASRNPARILGLNDRGFLETGKRADIIIFTVKSGKIKVRKTIVAGEIVYEEQ